MKRQTKPEYKPKPRIVADFEVASLVSKAELELIEIYMGDVIAELLKPLSSELND